jgi:HEPN domain-containing protein
LTLAKPRDWLAEAMVDLRLAKSIRDLKEVTYWSRLLFHCQQAVEKAIKSVLAHQKVRIPKSHDIRELSFLAMQRESSLRDILEPAFPMTVYAIAFRYPQTLPNEITEVDVTSGIKIAEAVTIAVANILKLNGN